MRATLFFPTVPHIRIEAVVRQADQLQVLARSTTRAARCPRCRHRSRRVHSHYDRSLMDLPCCGSPVTIQLRVRRFVCGHPRCAWRIFSERMPALVVPRERRTLRAQAHLRAHGFALGGAPGARHARREGLPVSRRTLVRLVRATPQPAGGSVRALGVDDFAFRKGQTYGTVLVDLEAHRVVDLLPDRTAEALAAWLRDHPEVQVISRDRASAYADGARRGAPQAAQVADRFHLLKNVSEAVERFLQRTHAALRAAAQDLRASAAPLPPLLEVLAPPAEGRPAPRAAQGQQARRARRYARYQEICGLHEQGIAQGEVARRLGIGRATVRRFLRAEGFPEQASRPRRHTVVGPFEAYLRQRWEAGCHNARYLYDEIRQQGYPGTVSRVRQFLAHWRPEPGRAGPTPRHRAHRAPSRVPPSLTSPRQATWLLLRPAERLGDEERAALHALQQVCPEVVAVQALAQRFHDLLTNRDLAGFTRWISDVTQQGNAELVGFVAGLQKDRAAVDAAFTSPWSQGQVEGQVNRIKTLKRSMYGRAKFDLLRQRMLHGV